MSVENLSAVASQDNTDVVKAAMAQTAGRAGEDAITGRMSELVKGRNGDNPAVQEAQSVAAEKMFRKAINKGMSDPGSVMKGLSPQFAGALSLATAASPQAQAMNAWVQNLSQQISAELGKNITLTSPLSSGLVPFDLMAPSRLIYPVYSPFRNSIPRTQGQGTAHLAKVISAVSGALPGSLATPGNRISLSEFPGGGSFNNWPNQLPAAGTQSGYDMSIPYKFFGLSESVSWLAQFAGQGFEDAAGLASLILLQEAMLLEERALISATSVALAAPTSTLATVASGSLTLTAWVRVTAVNFYGETAAGTVQSKALSGQNLLVSITPVPGALAYNVYVGQGASDPGRTACYYVATVGGTNLTVSAVPGSGAVSPAADTGTSATTDFEGIFSVVSGHTAGTVYPSGVKGSYVQQAAGNILSADVVNAALEGMWNGASGIFADPDNLWVEGTDVTRLAMNLAETSSNNYRFTVQQSEVGGVQAGLAVDQFRNPITRKVMGINVHPYFPQGTALLKSDKLPQPWSNVGNVWENVMVQDYLSIAWPVVDVTFRYSLLWYGTLFCAAPQYNGLIQGLQQTTVASGGAYS